jgi:predicted DNA-binding protein
MNSETASFLMKTPKAMTIRLSREQADALETLTAVEGTPVAEVVRAAIAQHVQTRTQDDDFQRNLCDRIERAQSLLRSS